MSAWVLTNQCTKQHDAVRIPFKKLANRLTNMSMFIAQSSVMFFFWRKRI